MQSTHLGIMYMYTVCLVTTRQIFSRLLTLKTSFSRFPSIMRLYKSTSYNVSSVSMYLLLSKNDVGANFTVDCSIKHQILHILTHVFRSNHVWRPTITALIVQSFVKELHCKLGLRPPPCSDQPLITCGFSKPRSILP